MSSERHVTDERGMATLGLSKVFILDKYFTELQKFWETEKKLQGEGQDFKIKNHLYVTRLYLMDKLTKLCLSYGNNLIYNREMTFILCYCTET